MKINRKICSKKRITQTTLGKLFHWLAAHTVLTMENAFAVSYFFARRKRKRNSSSGFAFSSISPATTIIPMLNWRSIKLKAKTECISYLLRFLCIHLYNTMFILCYTIIVHIDFICMCLVWPAVTPITTLRRVLLECNF